VAKNFQVVLDFLVNLKSDKSQVEKLADEMSSILNKAQPEFKIKKEEIKSQIELLSNFVDEISQSGVDVNEVLSNLNVAINDESPLFEIDNLISSAKDLDSALSGINLDELSNSLNPQGFEALTSVQLVPLLVDKQTPPPLVPAKRFVPETARDRTLVFVKPVLT